MVKNKLDFLRALLNGIYTTTDTIAEMTALNAEEAILNASVNSAAGFPRKINL